MEENFFAKCLYSGYRIIVHGMKYVLFSRLCFVGCACRTFGIGPGLASMSPHSSKNREFGMRYPFIIFCLGLIKWGRVCVFSFVCGFGLGVGYLMCIVMR